MSRWDEFEVQGEWDGTVVLVCVRCGRVLFDDGDREESMSLAGLVAAAERHECAPRPGVDAARRVLHEKGALG